MNSRSMARDEENMEQGLSNWQLRREIGDIKREAINKIKEYLAKVDELGQKGKRVKPIAPPPPLSSHEL